MAGVGRVGRCVRFVQGRRWGAVRVSERFRGPERGGHGAGTNSPRPGAARVGRLPSPAGRSAQRGHTFCSQSRSLNYSLT